MLHVSVCRKSLKSQVLLNESKGRGIASARSEFQVRGL